MDDFDKMEHQELEQKGLKAAESHQHHIIHFMVDGEPEETERREITPNVIIREFGLKDPSTNYLVRIQGGHKKDSYRDRGDEIIKLHNGMQFQIISLGPTTVSDGIIRTGVELFTEGLRDLGYNPKALPGMPDHIIIDYEVLDGRFSGQKVRHGFIVPADFPMTTPSGPHVSPHIHPINPSGPHPTGSIHHDPAKPFEVGASGAWQYWSRPFPNWGQSKKTVAAYMSHIYHLWATQ